MALNTMRGFSQNEVILKEKMDAEAALPEPEAEGAAFPPEFYSLVGLLNYCATAFPEQPKQIGWARMPGHVARLLGRRFREGKGFGWFSRAEASA